MGFKDDSPVFAVDEHQNPKRVKIEHVAQILVVIVSCVCGSIE
jgi:hypothetical protein